VISKYKYSRKQIVEKHNYLDLTTDVPLQWNYISSQLKTDLLALADKPKEMKYTKIGIPILSSSKTDKPKGHVSKCCNSDVIGTNYYICTACREPCDVINKPKEGWKTWTCDRCGKTVKFKLVYGTNQTPSCDCSIPLKTEPKEECKHIFVWDNYICGDYCSKCFAKMPPLKPKPEKVSVPDKIDLGEVDNDTGRLGYGEWQFYEIEKKLNEIVNYLLSKEK
jgi:hypothetical protein